MSRHISFGVIWQVGIDGRRHLIKAGGTRNFFANQFYANQNSLCGTPIDNSKHTFLDHLECHICKQLHKVSIRLTK